MTSAPRLELRQSQSQSLVMTQALQQSIKLLQMNAQELRGFVEEQLEQNPFLLEDERENDVGPPGGEERREAEPEERPSAEGTVERSYEQQDEWRDGSELRTKVTARNSDGDEIEGEARAKELSLREHLLDQLPMVISDEVDRRIAMHLIDLTDDAGYIKEDLAALAVQMGSTEAELERVLLRLQTFDPAGVCARNVPECLAIQLRERDRLDPAMELMLKHLNLLADGQLEQLKKKCNVDSEDLKQMVSELRALNPKPGLAFSRETVQSVEPDVTVKRDHSGNWHVELNTSALPRVLVNRRYYAKVSPHTKGVDKKYVSERMQEASWLVKALDQRANTILKVSSEIVAQQEGFFRMGIHHLKPLTLKDIARETGFHESTISRVTAGKYMITSRGTFELKYFFTSGVSHGSGGDDVSSQTVKHMIKELIESEGNKVLSDDDLADLLKAKSVNVARRTVAKYREALHIPSSMHRRRAKAMVD